jgi:hypothetical protein
MHAAAADETSSFPKYAEVIPTTADELTEAEHPSTFALSQAAKRTGRCVLFQSNRSIQRNATTEHLHCSDVA